MASSNLTPRPAKQQPARSSQGLTSLINQSTPTVARMPPSLQAKMVNLANRNNLNSSPGSPSTSGAAAAMQQMSLSNHPQLRPAPNSFPPPTLNGRAPTGGLAARRMKPNLNGRDQFPKAFTPSLGGGAAGAGLGIGRPVLDDMRRGTDSSGTPFDNFSKIVDPSGALNFSGKAVLSASGVNFSSGAQYNITMEDFELHEQLGRGQYGTVKRVIHRPTNVAMAMKEIRLKLEAAELNAIIMELDILHRAVAPEIVEFYGAFFVESCVYYCMEYMDAGSLDKLVGLGVPEDVLARISGRMVRGLKFLKDELQVIHRDVKPTNVLVSTKGEVKLCDFGVSGKLEHSLAKTHIGCQSYMAPERIQGESQNNLGTYTVASDVWSLGLSIIEVGTGLYPYPPETWMNVFAQLQTIVHNDPPELPDTYSAEARDFVASCLRKDPDLRATYAELLEHPLLVADVNKDVDMSGWVAAALQHRANSKAGLSEPVSV
ncbi:kinase-like protein [Flagelloscypha sp. PMI_526]|nr:kinase-like protein [Flagelloscypha sp. PMI_526]